MTRQNVIDLLTVACNTYEGIDPVVAHRMTRIQVMAVVKILEKEEEMYNSKKEKSND